MVGTGPACEEAKQLEMLTDERSVGGERVLMEEVPWLLLPRPDRLQIHKFYGNLQGDYIFKFWARESD